MARLEFRPGIWIPAAVVLLLVFVIFVGIFAIPTRASDLWMEVATGALQLAVIIIIGGAVAAVYRKIDIDREQRRARDDLRFEIFQQLGSTYQQLRIVRRNLKFAGFHIDQMEPAQHKLRSEQIKILRDSMLTIVEVTTTLEQITQELDVRRVFENSGDVIGALFEIVGYNERLIREWQTHGVKFWPDRAPDDIRDLPALTEFLKSTQKSFHPKVRQPYERIIKAVQSELPGARASFDDGVKFAVLTAGWGRLPLVAESERPGNEPSRSTPT